MTGEVAFLRLRPASVDAQAKCPEGCSPTVLALLPVTFREALAPVATPTPDRLDWRVAPVAGLSWVGRYKPCAATLARAPLAIIGGMSLLPLIRELCSLYMHCQVVDFIGGNVFDSVGMYYSYRSLYLVMRRAQRMGKCSPSTSFRA